MKKLLFVLFVCLFFTLSGCRDDDFETGNKSYVYKEYLIDAYIAPEQIKVTSASQSIYIRIKFSGATYRCDASDPMEKAEFERLAATHGGKVEREIEISSVYFYDATLGLFVTYTEDFSDIDVRSDQAWDAAHPAGSSLKDVFDLTAWTFAPFVRAGNTGYATLPVNPRLDKIVDGDLDMLAHLNISLYAISPPDPAGTRDITVTFTTKEGRTLSGRCQY